MPTSFNGCGTIWYGRALPKSDGSVVVTEWIVLVWIPLIPLGSKRVIRADAHVPWWKYKPMFDNYVVVPVPFYMPHIIKGYCVTAAIIPLMMGLSFLF